MTSILSFPVDLDPFRSDPPNRARDRPPNRARGRGRGDKKSRSKVPKFLARQRCILRPANQRSVTAWTHRIGLQGRLYKAAIITTRDGRTRLVALTRGSDAPPGAAIVPSSSTHCFMPLVVHQKWEPSISRDHQRTGRGRNGAMSTLRILPLGGCIHAATPCT
ncbi:hypothetical protein LY78DRAFT_183459 [Colletotrichum sublineola]|nr:hypothetical protein LY78DRAFT_183459 [Colletotrichum sublineola]